MKDSKRRELQRIAVVGLGKLGSCVAACLAARGFEVIGSDLNPGKVARLAAGQAPVEEPKLQETLARGASRLRSTRDMENLVRNSDAVFFIVPTLSLPDGSFDNAVLCRALRQVAEAVRRVNKTRYLFVINSTVTPGDTHTVLQPLVEEALGRPCGEDFGVCYNPEFIALGNVIEGLLAPDFVLIGESHSVWGGALERLYQRVCGQQTPVHRMSVLNAELTKISVNCAVTMKISFVNQLSEVCSKIPGADPGVILAALGHDRRIGKYYLKPGLGFGGPCFPRDNRLFQYVARRAGVEAQLAEATDRVNERVNVRLLRTVLNHSREDSRVAILGLAYKPFSNVTECSSGFWLCQQLMQRRQKVSAHDYMVSAAALDGSLRGRIDFRQDPTELFAGDQATFVIACPWPAYGELFERPEVVQRLAGASVVIDPWRMLEQSAALLDKVSYVTDLV